MLSKNTLKGLEVLNASTCGGDYNIEFEGYSLFIGDSYKQRVPTSLNELVGQKLVSLIAIKGCVMIFFSTYTLTFLMNTSSYYRIGKNNEEGEK